HLLAPLLMQPDHHNQRVVSGDNHLVALLSEHLASVYKLAPHMDAAEAQALMKPMLELTAAVLNAQVTEAEADAVALATTQRIRRYIEDHVTDRLSADAVASRFGMSRRKLYYLFEPFGGFAAYVQERRLRRAHADIVDPAMQHKSLATIA